MPSVISGGEDVRTMDRNSVGGVGRGTRAFGRSDVSEIGAVLVIFVMLAVVLTTVRRRRSE